MEPIVKSYKKKFDRDLRHIKIILMRQRHQMPIKEWLSLVEETKRCILSTPEEFFCRELPPAAVLAAALDQVFDGFLRDQRLLALQTPKAFRIPRPNDRLK